MSPAARVGKRDVPRRVRRAAATALVALRALCALAAAGCAAGPGAGGAGGLGGGGSLRREDRVLVSTFNQVLAVAASRRLVFVLTTEGLGI